MADENKTVRLVYCGYCILKGNKLGHKYRYTFNGEDTFWASDKPDYGSIIGGIYEVEIAKYDELGKINSMYPNTSKYIETIQDEDFLNEYKIESKANYEHLKRHKTIKKLEKDSRSIENMSLKQIKRELKYSINKKDILTYIINYLI